VRVQEKVLQSKGTEQSKEGIAFLEEILNKGTNYNSTRSTVTRGEKKGEVNNIINYESDSIGASDLITQSITSRVSKVVEAAANTVTSTYAETYATTIKTATSGTTNTGGNNDIIRGRPLNSTPADNDRNTSEESQPENKSSSRGNSPKKPGFLLKKLRTF
jgi:hypothetical protein